MRLAACCEQRNQIAIIRARRQFADHVLETHHALMTRQALSLVDMILNFAFRRYCPQGQPTLPERRSCALNGRLDLDQCAHRCNQEQSRRCLNAPPASIARLATLDECQSSRRPAVAEG